MRRLSQTESYNPTLGQSVIPTHVAIFYKISADSYNPTLGQSVIPTVIVCMAVCTSAMLQSHARAIRHSDLIKDANKLSHRRVTIPRSGNPSFRLQSRQDVDVSAIMLQSHARAIRHSDVIRVGLLHFFMNCYNPTLGQSVIPTADVWPER